MVTLNGRNFGPAGTTVTAVYAGKEAGAWQYTGQNCQVVSHVQLRCEAAPGVGVKHWWSVTIGGQASLTRAQRLLELQGSNSGIVAIPDSMLTSYAPPVINAIMGDAPTSVDIGMLNTVGGQEIVIQGNYFGPNNAAMNPLAVRTANGRFLLRLQCRMQTPHTALRCPVPVGAGHGYVTAVTIGGQTSAGASDQLSYHPPVFSTVGFGGINQTQPSPTDGGIRVFIEGRHLGPIQLPLDPARPLSGTGGVALPAEGQFGSPVDYVTYGRADKAMPAGFVEAVLPVDSMKPAFTSDVLDIFPSRLFNATSCRVTVPHTLIECAAGPGTGRYHSWAGVVGGLRTGSFLKTATTYASPFVAYFTGEAAPAADTRGRQQLVLTGGNFGANTAVLDSLTYGAVGTEYVLQDCQVTRDHIEVTCFTVEGAGNQLKFIVVVDDIQSQVPSTSYRPPDITLLEGMPPAGFSTRGGEVLTVTGTDFGSATPLYLDHVVYRNPRDRTFMLDNQADCAVERNHTLVRCVMKPGVGVDFDVVLTTAQQASTSGPMRIKYAPPVILAVGLAPGQQFPITAPDCSNPSAASCFSYALGQQVPTDGAMLRIIGKDFGRKIDGLMLMTQPTVGPIQDYSAASYSTFERFECAADTIALPPSMLGIANSTESVADFDVTPAFDCIDLRLPAGDRDNVGLYIEAGTQRSAVHTINYGRPHIQYTILLPVRSVLRVCPG